VTAWSRALGASAETQRLLETLTDAARSEVKTWQDALEGGKRLQDDIGEMEATARLTRAFQSVMVPGLLQTPDYAQRVLAMSKEFMPQIDVPSAVAERMNRQLTFYEEDKEFEFLITEGALRWRPGPPRLLLAQLDRIATMSTKDNVSIGIIPLLRTEATAAVWHPFVILQTPETPAVVRVETTHASLVVRAPDDLALYEKEWSSLRSMAAFDDDARALIADLSAEVRALEA
jgi:hypothetical protein